MNSLTKALLLTLALMPTVAAIDPVALPTEDIVSEEAERQLRGRGKAGKKKAADVFQASSHRSQTSKAKAFSFTTNGGSKTSFNFGGFGKKKSKTRKQVAFTGDWGATKWGKWFKETEDETKKRCKRQKEDKKAAKKKRRAPKEIGKKLKRGRKSTKQAKTGLEIVGGKCVSDHICAEVRGDPHITTYDGLKYDCQGAGEFVLAKSMQTAFEIQARFEKTTRTDKTVTITKAVSVDTGVEGAPQLDLFAAEVDGTCIINYYVNSVLVDDFGDDGLNYDGIEFSGDVDAGKENMDYVYFKDSGVMYSVMVKMGSFGCVLNSKICLPPDMVKEETIIGLLGTPNGDKSDEWNSQYGATLPYGESTKWENAYGYCTKEHCVHNAADSIFGYEPNTEWADFYGCSASYDSGAEDAVENASQECVDCCSTLEGDDENEACLLECMEGNEADCIAEIINEEVMADAEKKCPDSAQPRSGPKKAPPKPAPPVEEPSPSEDEPEPAPEPQEEKDDGCDVTNEPEGLDYGVYSGNPQCTTGFGFEYGWKMNGCQEGTYTLGATPAGGGEIKGECATADNIQVSVQCNSDKSATIEWRGHGESVVVLKVKGGNGGQLYDTIDETSGTFFAGFTRKGGRAGISHIEFCVQCAGPQCMPEVPTIDEPEPVPAPEPEPEPSVEEPPAPESTPPPAPDSPSTEDRTGNEAFSKGDPHFKTFGGELYDYHGECDLVLLHNPDFKQGLGMDIHIRTKIEAFWSSIESSVLKIGDDTMEIRADPGSNEWLWFNGQEVTSSLKNGEWNTHTLAGFLVRYKQTGPNTREANIYLKGSMANEVLVMKTFKSFVRIDINWQGSDNYFNTVGLLGAHAHEGQRLGRDGKFIENFNQFGQEWQVRPEIDGSLFHSYEGAVVGKKCVMPPTYHEGDDMTVSSLASARRRLGEAALDQDVAEKACDHLVDPEEIKACVFDVIATQDLNMASTW